jgi:hypothetical protein
MRLPRSTEPALWKAEEEPHCGFSFFAKLERVWAAAQADAADVWVEAGFCRPSFSASAAPASISCRAPSVRIEPGSAMTPPLPEIHRSL